MRTTTIITVVGSGGIDVIDVAAKSLVKTIKANSARWVIAIPSGEWLSSAEC